MLNVNVFNSKCEIKIYFYKIPTIFNITTISISIRVFLEIRSIIEVRNCLPKIKSQFTKTAQYNLIYTKTVKEKLTFYLVETDDYA